jgi:hypothetical protein
MPDLSLFALELRGMAATRYHLRIIPLAILAPLLSLWPHIGSPFTPAAIATMIVLEPCYNNALNMWAGQMTAGAVYPADWIRTLRRRNTVQITLTWGVATLFIALVSYVQPEPPPLQQIGAFALYLASVQFPLLMLGNSFSWQQVRGRSGWVLEDAATALIMLVAGGLVSLPWFLVSGARGGLIMLLFYIAGTAVAWWTYAVPRTAQTIHERYPDLWQQTHLT